MSYLDCLIQFDYNKNVDVSEDQNQKKRNEVINKNEKSLKISDKELEYKSFLLFGIFSFTKFIINCKKLINHQMIKLKKIHYIGKKNFRSFIKSCSIISKNSFLIYNARTLMIKGLKKELIRFIKAARAKKFKNARKLMNPHELSLKLQAFNLIKSYKNKIDIGKKINDIVVKIGRYELIKKMFKCYNAKTILPSKERIFMIKHNFKHFIRHANKGVKMKFLKMMKKNFIFEKNKQCFIDILSYNCKYKVDNKIASNQIIIDTNPSNERLFTFNNYESESGLPKNLSQEIESKQKFKSKANTSSILRQFDSILIKKIKNDSEKNFRRLYYKYFIYRLLQANQIKEILKYFFKQKFFSTLSSIKQFKIKRKEKCIRFINSINTLIKYNQIKEFLKRLKKIKELFENKLKRMIMMIFLNNISSLKNDNKYFKILAFNSFKRHLSIKTTIFNLYRNKNSNQKFKGKYKLAIIFNRKTLISKIMHLLNYFYKLTLTEKASLLKAVYYHSKNLVLKSIQSLRIYSKDEIERNELLNNALNERYSILKKNITISLFKSTLIKMMNDEDRNIDFLLSRKKKSMKLAYEFYRKLRALLVSKKSLNLELINSNRNNGLYQQINTNTYENIHNHINSNLKRNTNDQINVSTFHNNRFENNFNNNINDKNNENVDYSNYLKFLEFMKFNKENSNSGQLTNNTHNFSSISKFKTPNINLEDIPKNKNNNIDQIFIEGQNYNIKSHIENNNKNNSINFNKSCNDFQKLDKNSKTCIYDSLNQVYEIKTKVRKKPKQIEEIL